MEEWRPPLVQRAPEENLRSKSADDFILGTHTSITGATFTGLLTGRAPLSSVGEVRVEIYRVFPNDSDVGRTSGHRHRSRRRTCRPGKIRRRMSNSRIATPRAAISTSR